MARQVNWALVGLGDIAAKRVGAAIAAQPDSTLRACVTRDPAARAPLIETLQPQQVHTDLREALADPQIDAVYLATPVFLHAPQAIAALRAGKHVLVEKPMALNLAEAQEMAGTAGQAQPRLAVAYYRRFWPTFTFVKELIDGGSLGEPVLARLVAHSWYNPAADDPKAWRVARAKSGGGVLADIGCHRLDLLAWWFGVPREVASRVQTRTHAYDADDSVAAILILPGGAPCTVSFHWNAKAFADEIHLVGTEGKVTLNPTDGDEVLITRGRDTEARTLPKPANAHGPLIDDFARAILDDRPPRFGAMEGMKATRVMEAIYDAHRARAWEGVT